MKTLTLLAAAGLALSIPSGAAHAQAAYRCQAVAAGTGAGYEVAGCNVNLVAGVRTFDLSWAPNSFGQVNLRLLDADGGEIGSYVCEVSGLDVRDCSSPTGELANGSTSIDTTNVVGGQISLSSTLSLPASLHFTVTSADLKDTGPVGSGTYVAEGVFVLRGQ